MSIDQQRLLNRACEICGRSFARNEHLVRHQRIHSGERPFQCFHCDIGFPRRDVQVRHMRRFHPADVAQTEPLLQRPVQLPKKREIRRSRLACDNCRKRKLKCNNPLPCESCRSKSLNCTVSTSSRPPGRPQKSDPTFSNVLRVEDPMTVDPGISPTPPPTSGCGISVVEGSLSSDHPENTLDFQASMDVSSRTAEISSTSARPWVGPGTTTDSWIELGFPGDIMQTDGVAGGLDMMQDFLNQPYLGNWLDELGQFSPMDDIWPIRPPDLMDASNHSVKTALGMMSGHLQRPSEGNPSSHEEEKRLWYSTAPQLNIYDDDVINVLLNLARKHISGTFAIFSDFEAKRDTRAELFLAMAAVGGLYCEAPGAIEVAKKLFHDSRRLLLEEYLQQRSESFDESLSFAKTFILLEIYGLCSGNKRAFELYEAFHANMLHLASCCQVSIPPDTSAAQARQARLLAEAIVVLDSYRVLLLQRPPSLPVESSLNLCISDKSFNAGNADELLAVIPNPGILSDPSTADLQQLATIICHLWMTSLHDLEGTSHSPSLRPEYIELALDRWIMARVVAENSSPLDLTQLLLFHLAQVSLHTDLKRLQLITQWAGNSAVSASRPNDADSINVWRHSRHFEIARWHAKKIIQLAREDIAPSHRRAPSQKTEPKHVQAPHLPLCIYYAVLVLWVGEVASDENTSPGDSFLEAGSQLLFKLRVPVSKQLGTALLVLTSTEG